MADEDDALGVPVDPGESARVFNNRIQDSRLLRRALADGRALDHNGPLSRDVFEGLR